MNRNKFVRAAASAVLGLAGLAAAATPPPTDGHALLARCRDRAQPGACFNALIAVADMHDVVAAWGLGPARWCMPPAPPPARLRDAVLTWLEDPARTTRDLNAPATRLIAEAYAAAFPCAAADP